MITSSPLYYYGFRLLIQKCKIANKLKRPVIDYLFIVITGFYADIHRNLKLITDYYSRFSNVLKLLLGSICISIV